jgi:hypothetical protein
VGSGQWSVLDEARDGEDLLDELGHGLLEVAHEEGDEHAEHGDDGDDEGVDLGTRTCVGDGTRTCVGVVGDERTDVDDDEEGAPAKSGEGRAAFQRVGDGEGEGHG